MSRLGVYHSVRLKDGETKIPRRMAAVRRGGIVSRREPVPDRLAEGWALVAVKLAGINGQDIAVARGVDEPAPAILGSEFLGEVIGVVDNEELGVQRRLLGRVAVGRVPRRMPSSHLPHEPLGWGTLAEFARVPTEALVLVPREVPEHVAIFAPSIGSVLRMFEQSLIKGSDKVAVVGDGEIGWLAALVVSQFLGLSRQLRSADAERMEASLANSDEGDELCVFGNYSENASVLLPILRSLLSGTVKFHQLQETGHSSGYDVVIDATPFPTGLERCVSLVKPQGTVVLKCTETSNVLTSIVAPAGITRAVAAAVEKEAVLAGSCGGSVADAVDFLATGSCRAFDLPTPTTPRAFAYATTQRVHQYLERLITAKVALLQAAAGFGAAGAPGALKVIVDCRVPADDSFRSDEERCI